MELECRSKNAAFVIQSWERSPMIISFKDCAEFIIDVDFTCFYAGFCKSRLCTFWAMCYPGYLLFGLCTVQAMYCLSYVLSRLCTFQAMNHLRYILSGLSTVHAMYYPGYVLSWLWTIFAIYCPGLVIHMFCSDWTICWPNQKQTWTVLLLFFFLLYPYSVMWILIFLQKSYRLLNKFVLFWHRMIGQVGM